MENSKDFCVFILSNGRAGNISTINALKKSGYTGPIYIVCDNLDKQLDDYKRIYGEENVLVFDKPYWASQIDTGTNDGDMRAIVYARNACFSLAKELGYIHFMELDDDYNRFDLRWIEGNHLMYRRVKNIDKLFKVMCNFLDNTNSLTLTLAQGGDYVGGANGGFYTKGLARKAMNTFVCRTDRPFKWVGKQNEDVSTYTTLGNRGKLMFTFTKICIIPKPTQKTAGGMTEVYAETGGYLKPFSTVIYSPQAVKVAAMSTKHARMHHKVQYNNCTSMILNERYKKR